MLKWKVYIPNYLNVSRQLLKNYSVQCYESISISWFFIFWFLKWSNNPYVDKLRALYEIFDNCMSEYFFMQTLGHKAQWNLESHRMLQNSFHISET